VSVSAAALAAYSHQKQLHLDTEISVSFPLETVPPNAHIEVHLMGESTNGALSPLGHLVIALPAPAHPVDHPETQGFVDRKWAKLSTTTTVSTQQPPAQFHLPSLAPVGDAIQLSLATVVPDSVAAVLHRCSEMAQRVEEMTAQRATHVELSARVRRYAHLITTDSVNALTVTKLTEREKQIVSEQLEDLKQAAWDETSAPSSIFMGATENRRSDSEKPANTDGKDDVEEASTMHAIAFARLVSQKALVELRLARLAGSDVTPRVPPRSPYSSSPGASAEMAAAATADIEEPEEQLVAELQLLRASVTSLEAARGRDAERIRGLEESLRLASEDAAAEKKRAEMWMETAERYNYRDSIFSAFKETVSVTNQRLSEVCNRMTSQETRGSALGSASHAFAAAGMQPMVLQVSPRWMTLRMMTHGSFVS